MFTPKAVFFISKGLFYTNIDEPSMITNNSIVSVNSFSYLSTVNETLIFTDSKVEGAQRVQKLQKRLYWPVTSNLRHTYVKE